MGAADPNGLPLNARWRWQRDNPGVPSAGLCHFFTKTEVVGKAQHEVTVLDFADCTDQTDFDHVDRPGGFQKRICDFGGGFSAHLNWFPATYQGGLIWGDVDGADNDYTMALQTENDPAIINGRNEMHAEFDSHETIDHFQTRFWRTFHEAVELSEFAAVQLETCLLNPKKPCPSPIDVLQAAVDRPDALLRTSEAIMTGLFGLDLVHGDGKSELHPVFALAAHVQDDPADDLWAMFVRNWGNEGFCSQNVWTADFTTYTFRIPWRAGMTSVSVSSGINQTEFEGTAGTSGPDVVFKPGEGIDVTFTLPPPSQRPLIDGELHLQWRGAAVLPAKPHAAPVGQHRVDDHEEDALLQAIHRLEPAKRKRLEDASRSGAPEIALRPLPAGAPAQRVKTLTTRPSPALRAGADGVDALKNARDAARLRALCEAWDGAPPGLPPGICAEGIR